MYMIGWKLVDDFYCTCFVHKKNMKIIYIYIHVHIYNKMKKLNILKNIYTSI